jgi:hypothetical protein
LDNYLDLECPQKKGDVVWESKDVMMKQVPQGRFKLDFDGYTAEDDPLFCVRAVADMRPVAPPVSSYSSRVEVEEGVAFKVQA